MTRTMGSVALVAALAWPWPASAQIYTWRGADGEVVLSDRKPEALGSVAVRTYPVSGSQRIRSTREVGGTASRFDDLITRHALAHGVRADLVRAVIQTESAFDPGARSHKGAMGLMQLMPGTAADYGVSDPYDPDENIRGGVAYLRDLLERYGQNEELALAAYNAGPSNVDRYGRRVPPFPETRTYLSRVKRATDLGVASRSRIYRTVETRDGREVPLYTNAKPGAGAQEVTAARRR